MNSKYLRQIIREYFTFTKGQRNGLIFLCILLFIVIAINYLIDLVEPNTESNFDDIKKAVALWEAQQTEKLNSFENKLFHFNPNTITKEALDSLGIPARIKNNILRYRQSGGVYYNKESVRRIYGMNDSLFELLSPFLVFENKKVATNKSKKEGTLKTAKFNYFDPNTVSKETLLEMGFSEFQATNLVRFTESGGSFKNPEDILKIYGIDSVFFGQIEMWIDIKETRPAFSSEKEPLFIELNKADSVSLELLPGIGPVFASRIIKYRNLLGGFYSSNQLLEVYNFENEMLEQVEGLIKIDTSLIEKISLNFSESYDLKKHPYIDDESAIKIIEIRSKNGPYETCDEILSKRILTNDDYLKLKPYLKVN